MPNTYEFHFTDTTNGLLLGCVIDAPDPRSAWEQFEAANPPRRYLVTAMRQFWDGSSNQRVIRYYDPTSFTTP